MIVVKKDADSQFAELEKNPNMNTTKLNYIYIATELLLSLNVSCELT